MRDSLDLILCAVEKQANEEAESGARHRDDGLGNRDIRACLDISSSVPDLLLDPYSSNYALSIE